MILFLILISFFVVTQNEIVTLMWSHKCHFWLVEFTSLFTPGFILLGILEEEKYLHSDYWPDGGLH